MEFLHVTEFDRTDFQGPFSIPSVPYEVKVFRFEPIADFALIFVEIVLYFITWAFGVKSGAGVENELF